MTNALRSQLELNNTDFVTKMVQAGQVTEREAAKIVRAYKYAGDQAASLAKTQGLATASVGKFSEAANDAGRASSGMTRELIVLAHELSTGRYTRFGGSLLVIAEYSKTATAALSMLVGPIGIAIGALVAFGLVLHAGSAEQDKFNKSLVYTGNYAGVTAQSFEEMASRVANATGGTIGASKEALQALISTGKIGKDSLEGAGMAALAMERMTGESADKIAGDFATMSEGVAKWAGEHNRQMHFITIAEYKQIAAMEKAGNTAGAMGLVFDKISEKNKTLADSAGLAARAYRGLVGWLSAAKDALLNIGAPATNASQLADVTNQIKDVESSVGYNDPKRHAGFVAKVDALKQQQAYLQENLRLEKKSADFQSAQDYKDQKSIDAAMKADKHHGAKVHHAQRVPGFDIPSAADMKAMLDEQLQNASQADLFRMIEHGQQDPTKLFDKLYPKANVKSIRKYQNNNDSSARKFMRSEIADQNLPVPVAKKKPAKDTGFTEAINKYLKSIGDGTKFAETMVNGSMKKMEDAIMHFAATGKLSFRDLWSFMAQEYLRNVIKLAESNFLTSITGKSGGGWGGFIGGMAAMFSGNGHANGLDYVPYDGYPAILHKGERVQTAMEAGAGRGGTQTPTINMSTSIGSVGAGVNRSEMQASLAQNNRVQKAQLQRLRMQGILT